jgi:hypothetical protein
MELVVYCDREKYVELLVLIQKEEILEMWQAVH